MFWFLFKPRGLLKIGLGLDAEHVPLPVKITLDICGTLIEIQWDSREYPG